MSKAEPWMGSNIDGNSRSGLRFAVGAMPSEPERGLRSEKVSACRLGGHYGVQRMPGLRTYARSRRVHEYPVGLHLRAFFATSWKIFVPQHHAVALCSTRATSASVSLFFLSPLQTRKTGADAFDADPREHRSLGREFLPAVSGTRPPEPEYSPRCSRANDHPVNLAAVS
jgi:hypothetical protein